MKKVTIRDVAEDAGVSISIASFAINNVKGRVSTKVRQKVLESAHKLGYIPNSTAKNLRNRTSNTIAMVYDESYFEERNSSTMQFVSGVIRHGNIVNKDILIKVVNSYEGWDNIHEECKRLWASQRVEGIILQISNINYEILCSLKKEKINFVLIPPDSNIKEFNTVYINNYRLVYEGIDFIRSKGFSEVYYLTMDSKEPSMREQGYEAARVSMGLKGHVLHYSSRHRGKGEIWELLKDPIEKRTNRIAIACWNDVDAINVIDILHSRGINIPEDVGVLGFDDLPGSEYTLPPLTTIRQPFDDMAKLAVDLAVQNFTDKDPLKISNLEAPAKIIERGSL
jgi:LacI family transcriptional regulator